MAFFNFAGTVYDNLFAHLRTDVDRAWMVERMSLLYQSREYDYRELAPLSGAGGAGGWQLDEDKLYQFLTANYFE